jgi:hypothetical protein
MSKKIKALVLSGGGAYGSYQVGVLKALAEKNLVGWDVIAGVSVGAINTLWLSSFNKEEILEAIKSLEILWGTLIQGNKSIYKPWFFKPFNYVASLWKGSLYNTKPLLNLLKENTNDLHTRLEQIGFINKILNRSLTKEEYKKLILSNYIFHLSMEEKLQGITGIHQLNIKWKMPFLEKDKIEVGGFEFKKLEIDFEIKDITEALGCLYVLEGATLGGRVIKKHLEKLGHKLHCFC